MFKNFSGEIVGVFIVAIGLLSRWFGVPFFEEDAEGIVTLLLEVGGLILVYVRRIQRGDVGMLGTRKS